MPTPTKGRDRELCQQPCPRVSAALICRRVCSSRYAGARWPWGGGRSDSGRPGAAQVLRQMLAVAVVASFSRARRQLAAPFCARRFLSSVLSVAIGGAVTSGEAILPSL